MYTASCFASVATFAYLSYGQCEVLHTSVSTFERLGKAGIDLDVQRMAFAV